MRPPEMQWLLIDSAALSIRLPTICWISTRFAAHGADLAHARIDLDAHDALQLGAESLGDLADDRLDLDRLDHAAGAAVALLLAQDLLHVLDLHDDAAHVLVRVAHQRGQLAGRPAARSARDRRAAPARPLRSRAPSTARSQIVAAVRT